MQARTRFVEIVDAGNLSAAARRLNTTRSNVSHRLKTFEREIGVQLLRRSTRRMEPTQVGHALYEHGARIVHEMSAASAAVATLGKSLHGHVRISIPTGLGQLCLGQLLIGFAQRYPEITLEVVFSNRIVDLMASDIDVALRITSDPPEQYVARELARIDWVLCASPAYLSRKGKPHEPAALARHDVLSTPVGKAGRLTVRLRREGRQWEVAVAVAPHMQSESFLFLKNAVSAGLGLGILPFYAVHDELEDRTLVRVLPRHTVAVWGDRLYLITAPNLHPTLAARSLIEFMKSEVPQLGFLQMP